MPCTCIFDQLYYEHAQHTLSHSQAYPLAPLLPRRQPPLSAGCLPLGSAQRSAPALRLGAVPGAAVAERPNLRSSSPPRVASRTAGGCRGDVDSENATALGLAQGLECTLTPLFSSLYANRFEMNKLADPSNSLEPKAVSGLQPKPANLFILNGLFHLIFSPS